MLAKDNKTFKKYWDEGLNPDLDLNTLTDGSAMMIYYRDQYGKIQKTYVRCLCHRKGKKINEWNQVKKNKVFMSYWDAGLNPDVDLEQLGGHSKATINIINEYGELESIKISSLCKRKLTKQEKMKRLLLLKDIPEIMNAYIPELNLNVDLEHLSAYSSKKIFIQDENGIVKEATALSLTQSALGKRLAIDNPYFMDKWDDKLNPGVNLKKLTAFSTIKIKIRENGKIIEKQIRTICQNKGIQQLDKLAKDNKMFKAWVKKEDNPQVDLDSLPETSHIRVNIRDIYGEIKPIAVRDVCKFITTPQERIEKITYAKDNEIFMSYWDESLNPEDDLDTLTAGSKNKIWIRDEFNNIKNVDIGSICSLYTRTRDEVIAEQLKEKALIMEYDPDFFTYLAEDEEKVSYHCAGMKKYHFKCPCCNYEWISEIKKVAYRNPKCPNCKDQGTYQEEYDCESPAVYFLGIKEDNIDPA